MIITIALGIVLGLILLALLPAIIGVGIILIFSAIVIGIIFLIITFAIYTDWSFLATLNWNLIFSCLLLVLAIYFFIKLKDISNSFKFLRIYLKFGFLRTSPESVALYEKYIQIEKDKIEKKIKNDKISIADSKFNKLYNEVKLLESKINKEKDFIFTYSRKNRVIIIEPSFHIEGQFKSAFLEFDTEKLSEHYNKYYFFYYFKDTFDDGVRYSDLNAKPIVRELAKIIGKTLAAISQREKPILDNEILSKLSQELSFFFNWFEEKYNSVVFNKINSLEIADKLLKKNAEVKNYNEADKIELVYLAKLRNFEDVNKLRKETNWDQNIDEFIKQHNINLGSYLESLKI